MNKSHELLARYLNGDKEVTLNKIKQAERLDDFNYHLEKASFKNPYIKILVFPLVALYCFFKDS